MGKQIFCTNCGNEISLTDKFCGNCGNLLEESQKIVNGFVIDARENKNAITTKNRNSKKTSGEWFDIDWLGVYIFFYLIISIYFLCYGIFKNDTSRMCEDIYSNLTIWLSVFLILFHCVLLIKMFYSKLQFRWFHVAFLIEFISFMIVVGELNFKIIAFLFVLPAWFYFYKYK